jgi:hypothetical protein
MAACPDCKAELDHVDGRGWWCSSCLASKEVAEPAPHERHDTTVQANVGHASAEAADTAVSLALVIPLLLVGGGSAAGLAFFGLTTAAIGVAIGTLALAILTW